VANPVEILPLLVVALLLIGAQGGDVQSIDVRVDGAHTVTEVQDVLVVGGGTTTLPAEARVNGSLYVIGGDVRVAGYVDGDVVQLAGTLSVAETATITDELQMFGGEQTIATDATVGRQRGIEELVPTERSPVRDAGFFLLQALVLSAVGAAVVRRWPLLLHTVADSVTGHTVVSGTVGVLASATLVALVTFMAFTLVLLPVSLLGVLVGALVVGYSHVVFGYIVGRRLPVDRDDVATAAGVTLFVLAVELLGRVPVFGVIIQLTLLTTGVGAILVTYFGLREFEPVRLPE
jgi:hypothetical protein